MAAEEVISVKELNMIKGVYKKNMGTYYSKETFNGPWTRKWVRDIKYMLKNVPKLSLSKVGLYHKFVKDKFILRGIDGNDLIRVLKTSDKETFVPVVPWEDAFDPIWEAHTACGHGNVTEVIKILQKKYFLDITCVREVISLCKICSKIKTSSDTLKSTFNQRAQIIILDMNAIPDGSYKYILIYIDEATSLTQLRAVTGLSSWEVALKLLNIFSDLGPPAILKISDTIVDYVRVIDIMNTIFQPCCITLEACNHFNHRANEIKKLIMEWMAYEGTTHWEIGCYAIQWKMNNINIENQSPQDKVFGFDNSNFKTFHTDTSSGSSKTTNQSHSHSLDKTDLVNIPETSTSNLVHTYENAFDNEFDIEEPNLELETIESATIGNVEFDSPLNTKKKAYVNKKIVNSKQNVVLEFVKEDTDLCKTMVKTEPQEEDTFMDIDCASSNEKQDSNCDNQFSVEIQIENEFLDS